MISYNSRHAQINFVWLGTIMPYTYQKLFILKWNKRFILNYMVEYVLNGNNASITQDIQRAKLYDLEYICLIPLWRSCSKDTHAQRKDKNNTVPFACCVELCNRFITTGATLFDGHTQNYFSNQFLTNILEAAAKTFVVKMIINGCPLGHEFTFMSA